MLLFDTICRRLCRKWMVGNVAWSCHHRQCGTNACAFVHLSRGDIYTIIRAKYFNLKNKVVWCTLSHCCVLLATNYITFSGSSFIIRTSRPRWPTNAFTVKIKWKKCRGCSVSRHKCHRHHPVIIMTTIIIPDQVLHSNSRNPNAKQWKHIVSIRRHWNVPPKQRKHWSDHVN